MLPLYTKMKFYLIFKSQSLIEIVSIEIQKKAISMEFYSKEKLENENEKDIVKDLRKHDIYL